MKMKAWARSKLRENPQPHKRAQRQYTDGEVLVVGGDDYLLRIRTKDKQGSSARIVGATIELSISANLPQERQHEHVSTLLSRCVAQRKLPEIERRLHELNKMHFSQEIHKVFLKRTRSRWGSCSGASNINISTRLLFAPQEVIDHSERFWALVEEAMPDYREKVRWLKENGERCRW